MICVVGSKDGPFHFLEGRPEKTRFFCESDPDNVFYNEMCGHKWMFDNIDSLMAEPFLGLEHYRRAFDYSMRDICEALVGCDIILKPQHGPYGEHTNLSVLKICSRHGLDYLEQATRWVERWPELEVQAQKTTHYGANMLITRPKRYKEMMEEEFSYIREMLKAENLQRSIIGYFCETILTPYIVDKYNSNKKFLRVKCC